ncbi:MFS transporter [Pyricularia oryzae 70-15]|uniref:MFS transporter n=1 Tax=Pyricularia oryzae (strain 70-15 / ATCC MYA-4617 / FGSC 8958) TaxID=242507 RepID=G4MW46_PYRO7|nr:MFS transporter [Pyricularia oryzae 70-15]EHA54199.1 MFS transporter [Pyricularia oryzae 70-15]KAI7918696.1 MFS transporter [Pyricularia oryzae]KAI7920703.1 MFS transporter [Pyricularia oryzae]
MDSSEVGKALSNTHHETHDAQVNKNRPVSRGADTAAQMIGGRQVVVTDEDNKRIRRLTDKRILTILVWIYFLQILDKSVLGYGAIFGMREDCNLTGDQYSLVSSISAIVQLAWQPFSSWLIVKVPHRILMPSLVFGWGVAQTFMALCHNYQGLMATRALLGLFEAGCLPLFSIITSQWYRRAEQPMRVACWYGTNGLSTMFAAAVSYGLGQISGDIHSWQILFIFVGLMTVVSAPVCYWFLDNDIPSARFLDDEDKLKAIERLRANQTGTGSRDFKMSHVWEALLEPKTWLFFGLAMCVNTTAAVTNTFGPIVVAGFGFDKYRASLLNIPFGVVQLLVIFPSSWAAHRYRIKSAFLAIIMLPVLAGSIMLYVLDRSTVAPLLTAYYFLAFVFGGNPLIVSWMISNTGGTTKKSVIMSLYNAGSSAGNIIGPLLFNQVDAPYYHSGLTKVMGITCALVAAIGLQAANLVFLNKMQEKRRVANGKPRKIKDLSMQHDYAQAAETEQEEGEGGVRLGENAFMDLTDRQNDEFVYVY